MTLRHAFCIPAFNSSPLIEECIRSLVGQTQRTSEILITTPTPSPLLEGISRRYRIPIMVKPRDGGIADDWNFALTSSAAELVTLAHQDDTYDPRYVELMTAAVSRYPDALLTFSQFSEHGVDGPRRVNKNVRIKKLMCARAFRLREAISSRGAKRSLLSLGNPICCPSVIINRRLVPDFRFEGNLRSNLDWLAWATLAEYKGSFVYVRTPLVSKGIHTQSETSAVIADRQRETEDRYMFERFWSRRTAAAIMRFYTLGYRANQP